MWSAARPSTTGCEIRPLSTLLSPEAQRLAQNTEPRTRTDRRAPGRAVDERHPDLRTTSTPLLQAVEQLRVDEPAGRLKRNRAHHVDTQDLERRVGVASADTEEDVEQQVVGG